MVLIIIAYIWWFPVPSFNHCAAWNQRFRQMSDNETGSSSNTGKRRKQNNIRSDKQKSKMRTPLCMRTLNTPKSTVWNPRLPQCVSFNVIYEYFFFPAVLLLMKSYQSHFPVICRQTHNLYTTFLFSAFFSVRIQCFRLCSRSFPIPTYNVPPPYTCRRDAFKHIACWDWFMDEFLNSTVWPEFCVSVVCAGFFFSTFLLFILIFPFAQYFAFGIFCWRLLDDGP